MKEFQFKRFKTFKNNLKLKKNRNADLLALNADQNMPYDICEEDETLHYVESAMAAKGNLSKFRIFSFVFIRLPLRCILTQPLAVKEQMFISGQNCAVVRQVRSYS